jgi:hypothetical protein
MAGHTQAVAEFQGLYGPFTVAEKVLQKIWLHRDFNQVRARLTDGRILEVLAPGNWNLLGGPDFRDARLRVGGQELHGDIEVHFHVSDWRAHNHEADPAYGGVVLHVVLFPPDPGERPASQRDGWPIPTLALLPLLHRDLEEYAADDALESLTARDEWRRFAELAGQPVDQLREMLRGRARDRWRQKTRFARLRIEKLGWTEAAHQTALEILGYRRNRPAMLAVATRHPLADWSNGIDVDQVYRETLTLWQLHGVRPSNQPRRRLRQYAEWAALRPDWPEQLLETIENCVEGDVIGRRGRQLRLRLSATVMAEKIGGTRFDTLVCDGLLPLAAARSDRDLHDLWFDWILGDVPASVRRAMSRLEIASGRAHPQTHGYGQGLLGWIMDRGATAST